MKFSPSIAEAKKYSPKHKYLFLKICAWKGIFFAKDKYNFYIKNYPYPQGNITTHPSYTLVIQIHELVTVYLRCNKSLENQHFFIWVHRHISINLCE